MRNENAFQCQGNQMFSLWTRRANFASLSWRRTGAACWLRTLIACLLSTFLILGRARGVNFTSHQNQQLICSREIHFSSPLRFLMSFFVNWHFSVVTAFKINFLGDSCSFIIESLFTMQRKCFEGDKWSPRNKSLCLWKGAREVPQGWPVKTKFFFEISQQQKILL